LEEENEELKKKISHAPSSKGKPNPNPKKPGQKIGHQGFFRKPPENVDQVIEVPLSKCPNCQGQLEDIKSHEHFQEYPVRPIVKKFITYPVLKM
jgi:hypothetical protein